MVRDVKAKSIREVSHRYGLGSQGSVVWNPGRAALPCRRTLNGEPARVIAGARNAAPT